MVDEVRVDSTTFRFNSLRTDGPTVQKDSGSTRVVTGGERHGSDLPNWRAIIRRGENATTVFNASEYKLWSVKLNADCFIEPNPNIPSSKPIICNYWGYPRAGVYPATGSILSSQFVSADIKAREVFISKYRKARTAFQGGVFLGELGETIRTIKKPARALREGIDDYYHTVKKRVRRGRRFRTPNQIVSETWLEYVFGWRPLIRDIEDAVSLACASPGRYKENIKAKGVSSYKLEPERIFINPPSISYPYWYELYRQTNKVEVVYKGAAVAQMGIPSFPEQLGLSWSSLLPTVWELIPYSFLVDYFSNIGRVIEGISTGTVYLSWGMRTEVSTRLLEVATQNDIKGLIIAVSPRKARSFVNGAGKVGHRKVVNRIPIHQISLGLTDLRLMHPAAGSLKWLNIAGLATLRARIV